MRVKSGDIVARLPLDRIGTDFRRAELRFAGLRPPIPSYEARMFVDEPQANAQTPTEGNPHYLGSQYFYGLGVADGPAESQNAYGLETATQSSRREIPLNVTRRLRSYLQGATPHVAPLSIVAVDHDGNEIAEPDLDLEEISLVTC